MKPSLFKIIGICVILLSIQINSSIQFELANMTLYELFRNSYTVSQLCRNDNGIYSDSMYINATGYNHQPASIAANGVGIIADCVASKMGWIDNAEERIIQTLELLTTNNVPGFSAARNDKGFYRHFLNIINGSQYWNSEFSSIDTAEFVAGAIIGKKCFPNNNQIAELVDNLVSSIDWSTAIQDWETGEIYMIMHQNGSGSDSLRPFSEYMIVSWFAYDQDVRNNNFDGAGYKLFMKYFADLGLNNPTQTVDGLPIITDWMEPYLSSFVIQFPYYFLSNNFTFSDSYKYYFQNAMIADKYFCQNFSNVKPYQWGLGAGPVVNGYNADALYNDNFNTVSPAIVSGAIPVYDQALEDLSTWAMQAQDSSVYILPAAQYNKVLWQSSLNDTQWQAPNIDLIDFSSMIFGLSSYFLGDDFFQTFNSYNETYVLQKQALLQTKKQIKMEVQQTLNTVLQTQRLLEFDSMLSSFKLIQTQTIMLFFILIILVLF